MGRLAHRRQGCHADHVLAQVGSTDAAARSWLVASWTRCQTLYGLSPEGRRQTEFLDHYGLAMATERADQLLRVAGPTLDRLFRAVGASGCCVLLTDADGIVLTHRTVSADGKDFRRCGLWTGADWSEAAEGTNGIGTCLAERRALSVYQAQHFKSCNIDLSCVDAPIFDHRGRLIAALDVSTCRDDASPCAVALLALAVEESAARIESDLFRAAHPRERIVICDGRFAGRDGLLALNADDLVVGASRTARRAFGLSDASFVEPIPVSDLMAGLPGTSDLQVAERGEIRRALARAQGNAAAAARDLGIGRATLYRRMRRLGIR